MPDQTEDSPAGKKSWLANTFIGVWAGGVILLLAQFSLNHLAALPEPAKDGRLESAVEQLRSKPGGGLVIDVVDKNCSCMGSLFAHLLERRAFANEDELILLVGREAGEQELAVRSGYRFARITAEDLYSRFGIEDAPVLLISDPKGKLRYAGGYYSNPALTSPLDEELHTHIRAGQLVKPLPIYGCAVSRRLQGKLNPLSALGSNVWQRIQRWL